MIARPGWRFLAAVFGLVLLAFAGAYWQSFQVLPAADDYNYILEVHRGSRDGLLSFFSRSVSAQSYRPLTSVGLWAFGNLIPGHPTEGIRLLHLLSAALYAAVILPWVRLLRLGYAGSVIAIALMLLHPVFPQAVGSIDGFNSLMSSACLWLGGYVILMWRHRFILALLAGMGCFIVGSLSKEYSFALMPLSILVIICFSTQRRAAGGIVFGLVLGALLVGLIWIRKYTVPPSPHAQGGWEYVALHPEELLKNVLYNAVLFATALLFFGNSVWAYVNQSPPVMAIVGTAMLAACLWIAGGIAIRMRREIPRVYADPADSLPRWIVFLLLSFAAASFPANVMTHVSEMYVPPIVLPFALLCGIAADGWVSASARWRFFAGALAGVALACSVIAIRAKIAGIVDVGLRAQRQVDQILSYLPTDARDKSIAVRYLNADRRRRDLYAVFRMPDALLLVHRPVLEWYRPGMGLVLDADGIDSFDRFDPWKYDIALRWDAQQQQFIPLKTLDQ